MDDRERVFAAYEKYAERIWENGYRFNPIYIATKALSDWALLMSVDLKDKVVLNIGCAEPIDEMQFIERVKEWVAMDINEKMVESARRIAERKLHPELLKKLRFEVGDASNMPFSDGRFDVVAAFSTLEHIPDPVARHKAFVEVARVLKPGGHAVITVPNRFSSFYFAHRRNQEQDRTDYGYSHLYSPGELKMQIRQVGMQPIEFGSELGSLVFLPSWMPLPSPVLKLLRLVGYAGERIGFIARKEGSVGEGKKL